MSGISAEHQTDVHRAIVKAMSSGKLRFGPQLVVNAMAESYQSASDKPQNAMALTLYLAENLSGSVPRLVTRLMFVDRQRRMFFIVGRIHVPSAILLAIFALGFRTWLDISKHTYSYKER